MNILARLLPVWWAIYPTFENLTISNPNSYRNAGFFCLDVLDR